MNAIYKLVTMTNWLPSVPEGPGPIYLRLADQIESDISNGILPEGAKLPPQRDLAFDIKVTIGTIGRAYALLRERGLVSGEVGRGTYVLGHNDNGGRSASSDPVVASFGGTRVPTPPLGKLRFDTSAAPDIGQSRMMEVFLRRIVQEYGEEVSSYTRTIPLHWREAGSRWLSQRAWVPEAENIVPVLGAHAGINSVITAVTQPGDYVAFEELTYAQVARSAAMIGRRLTMLEADEHGIIPEEFERVCAQKHPKAAFMMPTAKNPSATTIPLERRREIVEIARQHNVWLVEDNLYGRMVDDGIPLLAELAPEKTFHVGGLSKSVAAGVRGGWVACPPHFAERLQVTHKLITGGMPFLLAELCASLVLSGAADSVAHQVLIENAARGEMAAEIFAGLPIRTKPNLPYFWLALPEPWHAGTFKQAAYDRNILIDDEDEFKSARSNRVHHAVRVAYSAPVERKDVEKGLKTLRALLDSGPAGYDTLA